MNTSTRITNLISFSNRALDESSIIRCIFWIIIYYSIYNNDNCIMIIQTISPMFTQLFSTGLLGFQLEGLHAMVYARFFLPAGLVIASVRHRYYKTSRDFSGGHHRNFAQCLLKPNTSTDGSLHWLNTSFILLRQWIGRKKTARHFSQKLCRLCEPSILVQWELLGFADRTYHRAHLLKKAGCFMWMKMAAEIGINGGFAPTVSRRRCLPLF